MSYYYPQACFILDVLFEDFQLVSSAIGKDTKAFPILARNLELNVNDYRTADSFRAEIDYKNFPFDPRSIRACGVSIYLQDMQSLYKQDGSLNRIIPNDLNSSGHSNAMFTGFVDEDEISFDDTKRTVHLSGRDLTALLIDQKYKENVPTDLFGMRVDVAIRSLIRSFPALNKIAIVNNTGGELPIVKTYMSDFGSALAAQRSPGAKESYWEIIQDMINRAGLIGYINLNRLILSTPRNQYNSDKDLKVIYGQNVKNLKFKRKLGRLKNFNMLVRSRHQKEVIQAKIPEEATDVWCKSFGIEKKAVRIPILKPDGTLDTTQDQVAPYIAFPVPNIVNKEQLVRIGQVVYEEYSRQQLEGSFDTHEMLGRVGVDNAAFDMTQLDIGHPIQIEMEVDDISKISRLASVEERIQYLKDRNYDSSLATSFATSMGKFSPRFFTKAYAMTLNEGSAFKMHVEFINILDLQSRAL